MGNETPGNGVGIRVIDLALYNLALINRITLNQAKILKALYNRKPASIYELSKETNLGEGPVTIELNELLEKKIVFEKYGSYFVKDFGETISNLIKEEKILEEQKQFA